MHTPEIDRVYNHLTNEIEILQSEDRRSGWTKWAIWGALGALIWLLLSILESKATNIPNIATYLLVIILITDLLTIISSSISSKTFSTSGQRFGITKELYSDARHAFILILIKYSILLSIVWNYNLRMGMLSVICIYIFGVFNVVLLLAGLVISYIKIPFPLNSTKIKSLGIINALSLVLLVMPVADVIMNNPVFYNSKALVDFKIAGLVSVLYYLALLLTRENNSRNLLKRLNGIRRKLAFGELDYDIAKEQIEIVLLGYKASSYLEPYIDEYLAAISEFEERYNFFSSQQIKLITFLDNLINELNVSDLNGMKSLKEKMEEELTESIKILDDKMTPALDILMKHVKMVKLVLPHNDNTIDELIKKVDKAFDSMEDKVYGSNETTQEVNKKLRILGEKVA